MNSENVDLVRDVLDHEVVDSDGVPCGMVDDLELEGGPGSPLTVVALRIGPGAWTDRLPWIFPRLARMLVGRNQDRIPWSEVALTGDRIQLKSTANELGLNAGDRKLEKWLRKIPGSEAD
jgi:hypothetical protein